MRANRWLLISVVATLSVMFAIPASAADRKEGPIQIGLIESLFRGSDAGAMLAQTKPFGLLLESQVGVPSEFQMVADVDAMARQLHEGKLQLAILHGVEYGWIKQQYPELKPLVVAFNQAVRLKGYLVVRQDSTVQTVADLKGKNLAFPRKSMNHCHLFLHKMICEAGLEPRGYFAPCLTPANVEIALDAVVDSEAAATVVDGVAFELYRERKPGRAAKLRILKESVVFPTATILYKPGMVDETIVQRFRDGLTTAHERVLGRQMLVLWRLSQFGAVPADYEQLVVDVVKHYPEAVTPAAFFAEERAAKVTTPASGSTLPKSGSPAGGGLRE